MLAPLRANRARQPTVIGKSRPAPVRGWDAKSSLAQMKPDAAIVLDNWFPEASQVQVRRGFESYATGMTGDVESLMDYASGSAQKLLAAANGALWDVSSSGAASSLASGFTSDRWQHTNMGTAGGQFIIMVNGADTCQKFDGTSVTSNSITGPSTPADLIGVTLHDRRLYFVEKNSLKFWYLAVGTISGAATSFDLAPLCRRGGYLMAIGSWTRDGGSGPDDIAVFLTSEGEALLYSGTDPGDATKWSLVGVFHVGAPIGRRCMMKVGADLVLITVDGFLPLSRVLPIDRSAPQTALSDQIQNAVTDATRLYKDNFGWQGVLYPAGHYGLFNIPVVESTTMHQYVVNLQTGAWARFKNQNANCWAVYQDGLYFGGASGVVYQADTGTDDDGSTISADVRTAFDYFDRRGELKRFTMFRPLLSSEGAIPLALDLSVDFESRLTAAVTQLVGSATPPWDTTLWDTEQWAQDIGVSKDWQSVVGLGYCASVRMRVAVSGVSVYWQSSDWLMEPGGYL